MACRILCLVRSMKVARARRPSRDSCSYRPTIRGYSLRTCLLGHVAPFPLEEMSNKRAGHLSQRVLPLRPQDSGESCGLSMFSSLTNLVYDYVINHARTSCVRVVDKHVSAGLDRCLDGFALFVYDVAAAFENIPARIIRFVLTNNKSFERLIIRCRAFLWFRLHYRSGYGDRLFCSCCLFLMRLCKCQRRDECAAGKSYNSFYHYGTSC